MRVLWRWWRPVHKSAALAEPMSTNSIRFDPLSSRAPLIIYIDFKSPYAYLAKDPTWALGDELGIEIDWRPFTLDIPSYLGSARLDKEGRVVESQRTETQWQAVKAAYHDVRRYGSLRKLVVRGTTKIWDSSLAAIGLLWAKQQGIAVLRRYMDLAYERFWKRELDIEDLSVIESVLREAGASTNDFRKYAAGEGREFHDYIQRTAFDAGIFGVPTYLVGNEMFFGREHLPRIRWILSGRHGAPPDVAYESGQMSIAGNAHGARLTLAIDFASPYAYLAVQPTCAMADQLGIEIDWQPFLIDAEKPPKPPSGPEDRGLRHRAMRAAYMQGELARYMADRGVVVRDLGKHSDSTLAAMTLLWLKRESPGLVRSFVEKVFEAYWRGKLNIEDKPALQRLLSAMGAPVAGYDAYISGEGPAELQRVRTKLLDTGVFEVPAYVVGNEVFFGRRHLPLIRGILAANPGRSGGA